ncbi:ABC transporter permease [Ohtaekwangia koreensis]|uniref:Putative ABC transport system permease protein n=1 Tax=Ohtaekwangia koreensis TaxID=688867 RepID=A0A1T5M309_9BACT|nr:ABC transporter permease [Ohtaekwangia koreensis]SKC82576.1 putative ABC transport system permease protein [Ohtaekwangia koreensis]
MFKNYMTSVWRYISRNKAFTSINVLGLAIGMMACMLITQYVMHEFSYDDFLKNKNQIFRVQLDRYDKGELSTRWASGCAGVGADLKNDFPEVQYYTRLTQRNSVFAHDDVFFKEDYAYFASEDFFRVFSIKLLEGTDSVVLKDPFKIVVSQSMAKKYFGSENPIGKLLKNNGENDYEITGVFEDLPDNSHMKIDILMSFSSLNKLWNDPITSWQWDGFLTYILLDERTNVKAFEAKLPAFVQKHAGEELKKYSASMVFHLQPVTDIHLDSDFIGEFKQNGNRQSTYFLSIVAVLILIIAWINYINLSTAKSIERAREVGVRKVMGGFRSQLIQQFLFESVLLNAVAVVIAIAFVILLTPSFSDITGRQLDYLLFRQKMFWVWMGLLIIGGALLSGLYPAFVLSGYKPVEVLKGRFKNTNKGIYFRKGMVITQFIASITLIVGTFTVYRQIRHMQEQELGVNIDQTLILNSPNVVDSTYQQKFQVFKNTIEQYSEVAGMTASTSIPGRQPGWNAGGIRRLSQGEEDAKQYRVILMDHDFTKVFGIALAAGRSFSAETSDEESSVLLNEAACRQMGFQHPEEALNDKIFFWGDTFKIVGVVKNYHQESLKKAYDPLVFRYGKSPGGYYSIKFNTANVKESLVNFENDWKTLFPGNPFIHFFLDDHYNQQYKADQQFGKVFGIFSTLAIFIACLGLFGLSSLTAIQRTKEIGVRKVLGASIPSILSLISKDYIALLGISIVVSTPLAWWVMTTWLQSFANRIAMEWWIFALPSLVVIAIALFTVSIHTIKAARTNPAKSLRYE